MEEGSDLMTEEELDAMVEAEEKRLGVGSKEFIQRHNEIMELIDRARGKGAAADGNRHKDNAVMTRILRERYSTNRPQEKGTGITIVQFGQSPSDRSEVFSKFVRTIYHACESGACPALSGSGRLKTVTDYYNFIAQGSLADMQPYGDESFDNLDTDFPVETENGRVENAGNKSSDFNFGFTPIR